MLVVVFRLDSPFLRDALARVPGATVTMEELYRTDENVVVHFWVEGGDPDAFEGALAADPTVADADELTETEARRLYRATCTDYGRSIITFPSWSELDVSFLEATATCEGWEVELRMPDRTALQRYVRVCQERELQFRLRSVTRSGRPGPASRRS